MLDFFGVVQCDATGTSFLQKSPGLGGQNYQPRSEKNAEALEELEDVEEHIN